MAVLLEDHVRQVLSKNDRGVEVDRAAVESWGALANIPQGPKAVHTGRLSHSGKDCKVASPIKSLSVHHTFQTLAESNKSHRKKQNCACNVDRKFDWTLVPVDDLNTTAFCVHLTFLQSAKAYWPGNCHDAYSDKDQKCGLRGGLIHDCIQQD